MLGVQPQVMEHEDIISSNSNDDDDHKDMQRAKVIDPKDALIYDERYGYAHDNLQYTASSQKQTPLMEAQIQPHKNGYKLTYLDIIGNGDFLFLFKEQG